ncbi:DUF4422 domain-containing protein [Gluconacetobacter tumulisoli]|uniref:DUF4422 domain-containing protein n=2 Tax=Gluconacetobacter tumulisoli TaxID=1286189 RepID=A0A7W4PK49_9PROT|nr:DUF4422 domain-containing protein [Gluconacetobacter tumulisoli]
MLSGSCFIPIQVGKTLSGEDIYPVTDGTGDNISERNHSFCELTALYWIWKNTSGQDYVGLFHYRRHLDFSLVERVEDQWGRVVYPALDAEYVDANNLTDAGAAFFIGNKDIILPRLWNVENAGSRTMRDHYGNGSHHNIADYDLAIEILKDKYPSYAPFAWKVNESQAGYFTNMFVMRRSIFDQYCAWLFDILFELEKRIDLSEYSIQEDRVFGYISEWLMNIFVEKYVHDHGPDGVKEAQGTFIENTLTTIRPFFDSAAVPVVMSFNEAFVPYGGACIKSLIDTASASSNYDIVVINENISAESKALLTGLVAGRTNLSIRFFSVGFLFDKFVLNTHMHFSKETYFRLYIPLMFSAYERVLYLDADMIVKHDVAQLLATDLQGQAIGAVRDCVMIGFRKLRIPAMAECGGQDADTYVRGYVGLPDPAGYFQAGVLIFDIARTPAGYADKVRQILATGRRYWFLDQDILNKLYQGNVHYLDMKWNVYHGNGDVHTFFANLPSSIRKIYMDARKAPYIIHYAGEKKPWSFPLIDFATDFWTVMRETPWYEFVLMRNMKATSETVVHHGSFTVGLRDIARAVANPIAPLGSKRRSTLRKIYNVAQKVRY